MLFPGDKKVLSKLTNCIKSKDSREGYSATRLRGARHKFGGRQPSKDLARFARLVCDLRESSSFQDSGKFPPSGVLAEDKISLRWREALCRSPARHYFVAVAVLFSAQSALGRLPQLAPPTSTRMRAIRADDDCIGRLFFCAA